MVFTVRNFSNDSPMAVMSLGVLQIVLIYVTDINSKEVVNHWIGYCIQTNTTKIIY